MRGSRRNNTIIESFRGLWSIEQCVISLAYASNVGFCLQIERNGDCIVCNSKGLGIGFPFIRIYAIAPVLWRIIKTATEILPTSLYYLIDDRYLLRVLRLSDIEKALV